jgi:hypothetical protein
MDSEIGVLRGASQAQLSGLEERTGLPLPASLRDWLSICNGPYIGADGTYGVAPDTPPDIETVLTYWSNWVFEGVGSDRGRPDRQRLHGRDKE